MSKIAALFSGQGAQYSGMGKELYENFSCAREIYEKAGDILRYDVAKMSFEGNEESLAQTIYAQPSIFTLSVAAWTVATQELGALADSVAGVAGNSLGEYAALCCAGAFSADDGFQIIGSRAKAMTDFAVGGHAEMAMIAIMGASDDDIRAACKSACDEIGAGAYVEPVNFNYPGQTVISGEAAPAVKAAAALEAAGAKTVRLAVNCAFHTKLMAPAAEMFLAGIEGVVFSPVKIPFYSNLTGDRLDIADYRDYFVKHMVSPVRFVDQITHIAGAGVDTCVEFGPKRTVATVAKKNCKSMKVYNVEDMASLSKLGEALSAG